MILLNGNPIEVTCFPDGTSQIWKLPEEILNETNYAHITWKFDNEGEFMRLAQLKTLLDSRGFKTTLKLPFLPYGRQDKNVSNTTTFALYSFADLLNYLNFDKIIIIDPHSNVATDIIKKSYAWYPVNEVMGVALKLNADLFCYPDKGAVAKYTGNGDVQKEIYDYPCTYGEKERDQLTGNILSYKLTGDVKDKNVLIVDDICDGGMTFILLAKSLLTAGAKDVNMFVTHGLFTKGLKPLKEAGINRIFSKDGEISELHGAICYKPYKELK